MLKRNENGSGVRLYMVCGDPFDRFRTLSL